MSIICLIFGHKLPSQAHVIASIEEEDFPCGECGRFIPWTKMHKKVRAMRDEYLRRRNKQPKP